MFSSIVLHSEPFSRASRDHRGREQCKRIIFFRGTFDTLALSFCGKALNYSAQRESAKVPSHFAKITCRSRRYPDFAIVLLGSFRRLPNAALSPPFIRHLMPVCFVPLLRAIAQSEFKLLKFCMILLIKQGISCA